MAKRFGWIGNLDEWQGKPSLPHPDFNLLSKHGLKGRRTLSGQYGTGDLPFHVGKAEIPACMLVGEVFVVKAKKVEDGGVEVVDVHFVHCGVITVVVGRPVGEAWFYASSGHPHGEAVGVVVASVVALGGRGAPEFAAPEDEGIFEEAAGLEVGEETGDGFVDFGCVLGVALVEIAMLVPLDVGIAVGDLDETDAALQETAGHEALAAKVFRDRVVDPVEFLGGGRFFLDLLGFGHGGLHPEGQFEVGELGVERGMITGCRVEPLVHPTEEVELLPLRGRGDPVVADVADLGLGGREASIADWGALAIGWKKGRSPVVDPTVGKGRANGDEGGEVFVFSTQAINEPGSHAGADKLVRTGVELQQCAAMGRIGAMDGTEDAEVVDVLGDMGEEDCGEGKREGFAVVAREERLGVESIDMGGAAFHEKEGDALGSRGEVGLLRGDRV